MVPRPALHLPPHRSLAARHRPLPDPGALVLAPAPATSSPSVRAATNDHHDHHHPDPADESEEEEERGGEEAAVEYDGVALYQSDGRGEDGELKRGRRVGGVRTG